MEPRRLEDWKVDRSGVKGRKKWLCRRSSGRCATRTRLTSRARSSQCRACIATTATTAKTLIRIPSTGPDGQESLTSCWQGPQRSPGGRFDGVHSDLPRRRPTISIRARASGTVVRFWRKRFLTPRKMAAAPDGVAQSWRLPFSPPVRCLSRCRRGQFVAQHRWPSLNLLMLACRHQFLCRCRSSDRPPALASARREAASGLRGRVAVGTPASSMVIPAETGTSTFARRCSSNG